MFRYLSITLVIAFGALGWAAPAGAGVIFDNGAPLDDSNTGANTFARVSDFNFPLQLADDFTLSPGANTVTDVHWWGVYNGLTATADDFTIRFFADAGGAPAAAPAHEFAVGNVGRTATGNTIIGIIDLFEFWTAIPATTLTANTPFWLSIVNDTAADPGDNWFWSLSADTVGNSVERNSDGGAWANNVDELAFQLTDDAVPEPATLALFAAGLAAFGFVRRRRAAHAV